MSLTALITHTSGFTEPVLGPGMRIKQRGDGLDAGTLTFTGLNEHDFKIGQSITQIPGMYVDDVESTDLGDAWEHVVTASGLLTAQRMLKGSPKIKINDSDWDTVTVRMLSANPNAIIKGQLGSYGGYTVCAEAEHEPAHVAGRIHLISAIFKGIIQPKSYRRVVTNNGQVVSSDKLTVNLPGGWTTAQKGVASLAKIVVTDTYFSLTPPDTGSIPGTQTPPNAPAVKLITLSGADLTKHYPSGWVYTCGYRQLPGVSLYEIDRAYEWQLPQTP